jgi:hypothetical protein
VGFGRLDGDERRRWCGEERAPRVGEGVSGGWGIGAGDDVDGCEARVPKTKFCMITPSVPNYYSF